MAISDYMKKKVHSFEDLAYLSLEEKIPITDLVYDIVEETRDILEANPNLKDPLEWAEFLITLEKFEGYNRYILDFMFTIIWNERIAPNLTNRLYFERVVGKYE